MLGGSHCTNKLEDLQGNSKNKTTEPQMAALRSTDTASYYSMTKYSQRQTITHVHAWLNTDNITKELGNQVTNR